MIDRPYCIALKSRINGTSPAALPTPVEYYARQGLAVAVQFLCQTNPARWGWGRALEVAVMRCPVCSRYMEVTAAWDGPGSERMTVEHARPDRRDDIREVQVDLEYPCPRQASVILRRTPPKCLVPLMRCLHEDLKNYFPA
jgi:hypothetical protein